jgi:hypothetical protein
MHVVAASPVKYTVACAGSSDNRYVGGGGEGGGGGGDAVGVDVGVLV